MPTFLLLLQLASPIGNLASLAFKGTEAQEQPAPIIQKAPPAVVRKIAMKKEMSPMEKAMKYGIGMGNEYMSMR